MAPRCTKFSILVPVYNEQETLQFTQGKLTQLVRHPGFKTISTLEILFVNDGSTDRTAEILATLEGVRQSAEGKEIITRQIEFSRNFGHSAAVMAGLQNVTGDYIAIIDADLQDPPGLIPRMYEDLVQSQVDVVYGKRTYRKKEGAFKKTTAWFFYRIILLITDINIPRDTGDFRVITAEVKDAIASCRELDPFLRGIVSWAGFRQKPFPYVRQGRRYGVTKYSMRRMMQYAFRAILSFSSAPLLGALWLGALGLLGCIVIGGWALYVHMHGRTVSGWTSLLISFMFGQSATLVLLGIMGAYIARMHQQLQARPRFIIRRNAVKNNSKARNSRTSDRRTGE